MGGATIRHIAEATRRAFHVRFRDAPLIPRIRTAIGIDATDAVLARPNVAAESKIRGAAIAGGFARTVDRTLDERLVGTALVPSFDAALLVEPADTVLTAPVVTTDAIVSDAAVCRSITCAVGSAFRAGFVHTTLVPRGLAAGRVQIANARFAPRVVALRSGMGGTTVTARCRNGRRCFGRQRPARTVALAFVTGSDDARCIPYTIAAERICTAHALRTRCRVATRPGVNRTAVTTRSRSRRNARTVAGTLIRVGCKGYADPIPTDLRLTARKVAFADASGTAAVSAARSGMLTATVTAEGRRRTLASCRVALKAQREE
jgi:hypothetical protein